MKFLVGWIDVMFAGKGLHLFDGKSLTQIAKITLDFGLSPKSPPRGTVALFRGPRDPAALLRLVTRRMAVTPRHRSSRSRL
jgi:hypothetical protein